MGEAGAAQQDTVTGQDDGPDDTSWPHRHPLRAVVTERNLSERCHWQLAGWAHVFGSGRIDE
jgi:hypothetical protein